MNLPKLTILKILLINNTTIFITPRFFNKKLKNYLQLSKYHLNEHCVMTNNFECAPSQLLFSTFNNNFYFYFHVP